MCDWNTAVTTVGIQNCLHTIKLAMLFLTFKKVKHSLYQVIDIQNFEFRTSIIHSERLVICHCPAESCIAPA